MRGVSRSFLFLAVFIFAKALNLFRFAIVQPAKRIARFALDMQKFIKLRMDGLRVAMARPLDEKRHEPSREGRKSLQIQRAEISPAGGIKHQYPEGPRAREINAELCQPTERRLNHGRGTQWRGAGSRLEPPGSPVV